MHATASIEQQAPPTTPIPVDVTVSAPPRNIAVDAYRGFVMLLMMGEVMRFAAVARAYPDSLFWRVLGFNQSHVPWAGMSLHDTIQPGFTFLVGVAMPYSIASRVRKGESFAHQLGHAIWRSFLLIIIGFFLRSLGQSQTYFTFEDTLTQIGLGYTFSSDTGWRGHSIPRPDRTSITTLSVFLWAGPTTSPGSLRTGT